MLTRGEEGNMTLKRQRIVLGGSDDTIPITDSIPVVVTFTWKPVGTGQQRVRYTSFSTQLNNEKCSTTNVTASSSSPTPPPPRSSSSTGILPDDVVTVHITHSVIMSLLIISVFSKGFRF